MPIKKSHLLFTFIAAAGLGAGSILTYRATTPGTEKVDDGKNIVLVDTTRATGSLRDTPARIEAVFHGNDNLGNARLTAHIWPGHYVDIVVKKNDLVLQDMDGKMLLSVQPGQQVFLPWATGFETVQSDWTTVPEAKEKSVRGTFAAVVVRVIDGDTFEAKVALPEGCGVINTGIRINGIDTPEKGARAACPEEAKLAEKASMEAKRLLAGDTVFLSNVATDKYGGRFVSDVYTKDKQDVAAILISKGMAKKYDGGKKSSWCH